jgi:Secretion system C-terminal sorting domain
MKRYVLNLFFVLLISNFSFGQVEYFVQVNPTTCSYTIIDSLSGVKWIRGGSDFDKINKRYIFNGEDVNNKGYLYRVDAANGSIISNPPWGNYFSLVKFDNSTGILYGIYADTTFSINGANLVSINPTNFTYTIINHINLNSLNGDVTFDDINHRYLFIGDDNLGNHCLFCIDALTGNIISKPSINSLINCIQFDNSSGNLYGLQWDNSLQKVYFDSINIANGNTTIINSIPSIGPNYWYSTFNEINKQYTFVSTASNNNQYLYTINAINGNVISNPPYPVFASPYNLVEFKYDNSSGNLYALHWGQNSELITNIEDSNQNSEVIIFPNPTSGKFTIQSTNVKVLRIEIYNILGEMVYSKQADRQQSNEIDISFNTAGIYFIGIQTSEGKLNKKIILKK